MMSPAEPSTYQSAVPSRVARHRAKKTSRIAEPTASSAAVASKNISEKSTADPYVSEQPTTAAGGLLAPTDASTTFGAVGVQPWLVQSLANMAITRPTAIQKQCIPEILKGRDCIGGSRTGSGKTVAFAVPILQAWAADPSAIYALVLTPTRQVVFSSLRGAGCHPSFLSALMLTCRYSN